MGKKYCCFFTDDIDDLSAAPGFGVQKIHESLCRHDINDYRLFTGTETFRRGYPSALSHKCTRLKSQIDSIRYPSELEAADDERIAAVTQNYKQQLEKEAAAPF